MCMLQGLSRQAYLSTLWLCAKDRRRTFASYLLPLASTLTLTLLYESKRHKSRIFMLKVHVGISYDFFFL